jgi:fructose-bisphosphate aldolase class 1
MGARFAKWRAVIAVGEGVPSRGCVEANAQALARYAALCQEAGLVPIVEPEVLMDGEHSLERSFEVTEEVLRTAFNHLYAQRVLVEGMILKPNTVSGGLVRNDPLWPSMETSSCLDLLGMLGEGDALVGDFLFEICDCRDVLVDDRFVDKRP